MTDKGIFEFASPEWLWLLFIVPVIVFIYGGMQLWKRHKLRRFGNMQTLRELMPERSVARGWVKVSLIALAIGFIIMALARPQTGTKLRSVETKGREIMLVVDVSNSMYAEDTEPSRMERTRYAITQLVKSMKEDHIGIVAFAEDAEVVLPITSDYKMAESKVRRLSPALIQNQGTNIGKALEVAQLSFTNSTHNKRSRVIILITDGEGHDNVALDVAEQAAEQGIVICCIGIGTPEGTALKIGGKIIEDEDGKIVVTKLNEELLQQIASTSEGIYTRSSNNTFGLKEIVEEVETLDTTKLSRRNFEEYDEEYQWFLGVALLLLIIESIILNRRNPLLRGIRLFDNRDSQKHQ